MNDLCRAIQIGRTLLSPTKAGVLRPCTLAALFLLLLSACAGSPPPSASPITPTDLTPVTLTFWHTETGPAAALLNTLADDFHKAYPSITVQGEAKPSEGDLLRQGIAAMAMNQLPDFIIADNRTIGEFARKGAAVPLDPLLNDPTLGLRPDERGDYFPGLLDVGRFPDLKNQLFAFPFDENAVVLYYNVDLLNAAKVDVPRTWDQFNLAARATTKGNARGWAMTPSAAVFDAFLFSRGSRPLDDAQTQAQFTDDAGVKSLQLIAALSAGGSAYLVDHTDAARADFALGKTALLFDTTDDLTAISDAMTRASSRFQWGVTNIPQNDPTHPVTAVLGENIAIFTPVPTRARAAWLFARWLAEPAQTARWARTTLSIPLRASALPLLATGAPTPLFQRLRDGFGDAIPSSRAVPAVENADQVDAAIVQMWTAVANGGDIPTAQNRAATQVNRLLSP